MDDDRTPGDESGDRPPPPRTGCQIELIDSTGRLAAAQAVWLRTMLERACDHLTAEGEVRLRVVDDAEMAAAHERWSGVGGTTDVLTFDLREEPEDPIDADILICIDEAHRRSAERGHGEREELLLYALHGVLHCLGQDDHTDEGYASMHAMEDQVLLAIGVGAVFARPAAASGPGEAGS